MKQQFDIEIANKYGLAEAIILESISKWVLFNKRNNKNKRDGEYWTYNSYKEWLKLFPYLTESKIRTALKNLQKSNLIKIGKFNKDNLDRTLWYTTSYCYNSQIVLSKTAERPSLYNNNNIKQQYINKKENIKEKNKEFDIELD